LHRRHQQLDCPRAVHLFAHDRLDLANRPQPDRQVVVDAAGHAPDHAGAHHQFVADDFRVSGSFLQGADKETGGFHSEFSKSGGQDGPPEEGQTVGFPDLRGGGNAKPFPAAGPVSGHPCRHAARCDGKLFQPGACPVRQDRYLFIIKAILKDSKVVVCWIVKAFARTSASSS
jgi:hypothetical protein